LGENFFDDYPVFYKTSPTGASTPRLNARYDAMIKSNKDIIENSSILDLGSHDGRWSFAAIKNNASKVLGIERNEAWVKTSIETMKEYNIPPEKYSFIIGDMTKEIKNLKPGSFDVVFCLGIFYHISDHPTLLMDIKKLKPKYLILDTKITGLQLPTIRLRAKNYQNPRVIKGGLPVENWIVGMPSRSAIDLMLDKLRFSFEYYDWHEGRKDWEGVIDYKNNHRVTLVAKNLDV